MILCLPERAKRLPAILIAAAFVSLSGCQVAPTIAQIAAPTTSETRSLADVLEDVTPAVINIAVISGSPAENNPLYNDPYFRRFFDLPETLPRPPSMSAGSGVIVDAEEGYVITNNHVIEGASEIAVTLTGAAMNDELPPRLAGAIFQDAPESVFAASVQPGSPAAGAGLVLTLFWGMIAPLAGAIAPIDPLDPMTMLTQFEWQQAVARISPQTLYGEVTAMLLDPSARSVSPLFFDQLEGAVIGAPLPTAQSLLAVWPQISGLVAAILILLSLAYMTFQRRRCGHDRRSAKRMSEDTPVVGG